MFYVFKFNEAGKVVMSEDDLKSLSYSDKGKYEIFLMQEKLQEEQNKFSLAIAELRKMKQ